VGRRPVEERRDLHGLGGVCLHEVSTSARARDLSAGRLCARRVTPVVDDDGGAGLREPEGDRRADPP